MMISEWQHALGPMWLMKAKIGKLEVLYFMYSNGGFALATKHTNFSTQ